MRNYLIAYKNHFADDVHYINVMAQSKYHAWDKAVNEILDEYPYSAWVEATINRQGKITYFNNHEGNPY